MSGILGIKKGAALMAVIIMAGSLIGISVYGVALGFGASLIVGLLVLLIEPAPFIVGIIALASGFNIAEWFANLTGL